MILALAGRDATAFGLGLLTLWLLIVVALEAKGSPDLFVARTIWHPDRARRVAFV